MNNYSVASQNFLTPPDRGYNFLALFSRKFLGADKSLNIFKVARRGEEGSGLCAVRVVEVSCPTGQHHLYSGLLVFCDSVNA